MSINYTAEQKNVAKNKSRHNFLCQLNPSCKILNALQFLRLENFTDFLVKKI